MKRLLLVSLCLTSFAVNAMQQEQRSPLRQQLDAERGALLQLQQPLLDDDSEAGIDTQIIIEPITPAHQAGGASADNSPDRAVIQKDFGSLVEYLKENPEAAKELRDALGTPAMHGHVVSLKKRLAIAIPEMMVLAGTTVALGLLGHLDKAAVMGHITAAEMLRNLRGINLLGQLSLASGIMLVTQLLETYAFHPSITTHFPTTALFYLALVYVAIHKENNAVRKTQTTFVDGLRFVGRSTVSLAKGMAEKARRAAAYLKKA